MNKAVGGFTVLEPVVVISILGILAAFAFPRFVMVETEARKALVTSLWRSNDAATSRMMKSFYQSLVSTEIETDALRGAEALRRAKLEQLANESRLGIRRPLIWANFIFSGVL